MDRNLTFFSESCLLWMSTCCRCVRIQRKYLSLRVVFQIRQARGTYFFMTKWNINIFGHMEFALCLIFFSVLGRKARAREMAFFSLVVLLKQQRVTNQHLVLTLILWLRLKSHRLPVNNRIFYCQVLGSKSYSDTDPLPILDFTVLRYAYREIEL